MQCPILTNLFKIYFLFGVCFLKVIYFGSLHEASTALLQAYPLFLIDSMEVGFDLCWNHMNSEMPILVK